MSLNPVANARPIALSSASVAEAELALRMRTALSGQVPMEVPWAYVAMENCDGKGDSAQMMSPLSGRFTTNSVPSLQTELRL